MKLVERRFDLFMGAGISLTGFTLLEIMITYKSDYHLWEMIVYCALALAAMAFGLLFYIYPDIKKRKGQLGFVDYEFKAGPSSNKLEKKLEDFKKDFASFFAGNGIKENADIQNDTTQTYKSILDLQKKRLDHLGVKLELLSERRKYTGKSVRYQEFFDGKYQIREVEEEMEAYRRYSKDGKTLLVRHDSEVAHYTLINAKQTGQKSVICPNCGNETSRENLIDGCDYCKTKFTVEDLGEKVADFALRDDYEVAYAKYKHLRLGYLSTLFVILFTGLFLLFTFCMLILMLDEGDTGAIGTTVSEAANPLLLLLGFVGTGASFAGLIAGALVFAGSTILLPSMEIGAAVKYNSKKKLDQLKKEKIAERSKEMIVKRCDPLFSIMGFYSNVQNKLSVMLFGQGQRGREEYKNVIDYDVDTIELVDYRLENGLQKAQVNMDICLYELLGKKVKDRKKAIKIRLVKSEACKTQAVCGPSIMTCQKCGANLSFEDDLECQSCGTKLDLKLYDWAIDEVIS